MTTRYYEETPCEHGFLGECGGPRDPAEWLFTLASNEPACPGGQRRELTGVEVVKAWPYEDTACIHMHALPAGRYAIIPLEEPE